MIELNSFQIRCRDELVKELTARGFNIPNFSMKTTDKKWFAEKEVFLEASLNYLEIWIYEDGAHIRSRKGNLPFEALDYSSDDDLINAFIENVIALLTVESH